MTPDFEVDTEDLRRAAAALAATAGRVHGSPPEPPPTPRWATTGAAELAASTARRHVALLGDDVEETARRIRAAAEAYEEADARAANRLRLTR